MTSPDSAVPAAPSDRTLAHRSAAFTYEADCADVHAELVEAKLRDYPWTRCSSSIAPDRTAMAAPWHRAPGRRGRRVKLMIGGSRDGWTKP